MSHRPCDDADLEVLFVTKEAAFLKLASLLTGLDDLDQHLAKPYLHKLEEKFPTELDELLGVYSDTVEQADPLKALTDCMK